MSIAIFAIRQHSILPPRMPGSRAKAADHTGLIDFWLVFCFCDVPFVLWPQHRRPAASAWPSARGVCSGVCFFLLEASARPDGPGFCPARVAARRLLAVGPQFLHHSKIHRPKCFVKLIVGRKHANLCKHSLLICSLFLLSSKDDALTRHFQDTLLRASESLTRTKLSAAQRRQKNPSALAQLIRNFKITPLPD